MISAAEEKDLITRAKSGDRAAIGDLFQAHSGYFYMLAKRVRARGEDIEDRVQEARMSALKVLEDFDPARGVRFMTFAARAIVWDLKRLRDRSGLIRTPQPCNFDRINPTLKEQATKARQSHGQLHLGMAGSSDVLGEVERNESAARVRAAFSCLSEREQRILAARLDGKTLLEIGANIGVTRERVRQIESKALAKIEKRLVCGAMAARRKLICVN